MAILKIQKKKEAKTLKSDAPLVAQQSDFEKIVVLKNPRITEKVSRLMELGMYTFDVLISATKKDMKHAIFARYNVMPESVNMLRVVAKKKFTRGKLGRTARGKKALIRLKKGDKIDIM